MNITIRPTEVKDAKDIYNILRDRNVCKYLSMDTSLRIDEMEDKIKNMSYNTRSFVACINENNKEQVVGQIVLIINNTLRLRHIAHFSLLVDSNYHGFGIGSKLMEQMLILADDFFNLQRVELEVQCDNERAIKLYKKFGFEIEGTKRRGVYRDGKFIDVYVMGRIKEI